MQLLNFVQKEFDITLANDEISIPNFSSVNNIVGLITLKQNI
jgi:acyl carrier protein